LLNWGEQIISLRSVLRRFSLAYKLNMGFWNTEDFGIMMHRHYKIPPQFGFDPNGIHTAVGLVTTASNFPMNFVRNTPLTWVLPMYLGYRGSTNNAWNYGSKELLPDLKVDRETTSLVASDYYLHTGLATRGSYSQCAAFFNTAYSDITSGSSGCSLVNQNTQTGLVVQYPYMTKYRFTYCHPNTFVLGDSNTSTADNELLSYTLKNCKNFSDNMYNTLDRYVSIGSDFNCYFFLNAPTYFVYASTPTAV